MADTVRSIPIVDPVVDYSIGLVIPQRDPMTPADRGTGDRSPAQSRRRWNNPTLPATSFGFFRLARQFDAHDGAGAEFRGAAASFRHAERSATAQSQARGRALIRFGELALDLFKRLAQALQ
jgi:hypothetical protein